jgi:hypothetical protein
MPSTTDSDDRENTMSDPTILTEAFSSFRNAFENLLRGSNELQCQEIGITPADMDSFRSRHSNAPYLCRHSGCARTTFGFDTVDERKEHESTHTPKFLCMETDCEERFTTRRALQIHTRKYHSGIEDIILPPFPASDEPAGPKRLQDITQEGTDSLIRPGSDPFLSFEGKTLSHPSVQQYIFDALRKEGPFTGWQAEFHIRERAGQIKLLVDSLGLVRPPIEMKRAVEVSLQFERKCFAQSVSREDYRRECNEKLGRIRDQRDQRMSQDNPGTMQATGIQGMQMPNQNFPQMQQGGQNMNTNMSLPPHLQEQMQVTQLLHEQHVQRQQQKQQKQKQQQQQTAPQPIMSQPQNAGGQVTMMQGNENQQKQNQVQEMTAEEIRAINLRAAELAKNTPKEEMRNIVEKINPQLRQNLAERSIDPIIYYFRMLATKEFRARRRMEGGLRDAGNAGQR